jgi:hypothetical protein
VLRPMFFIPLRGVVVRSLFVRCPAVGLREIAATLTLKARFFLGLVDDTFVSADRNLSRSNKGEQQQ